MRSCGLVAVLFLLTGCGKGYQAQTYLYSVQSSVSTDVPAAEPQEPAAEPQAPDSMTPPPDSMTPPPAATTPSPDSMTPPPADMLTPEPKPATAPTPIASANPNTVTTISTNQGQTSNLNAEISAGAGFSRALGGWGWTQPGGYLEYNVDSIYAAPYGLALYYGAPTAGTVVDFYVNDVLVGKRTLNATSKDEVARTPVVLAAFKAGKNTIRIVTGLQTAKINIQGLEVNFPGNALVNFGKIQDLPSTMPLTLIQDAVIDFYRLGLNGRSGSQQTWACVWSFCAIEFLVQSPVAVSMNVTISYSQQSLENHACAGFSVNGIEQAQVEMKSATGVGVTAPKTINFPAGVSRFRIANTNYYNNVFCYGADWRAITLTPVPF